MARALFAVAVVALVAVSLVGANPNCDPSYECKYTVPGTTYNFDFSSLCSSTDYSLTDQAEHSYKANICGTAKAPCLPQTWKNNYEYGVAVQFWGAVPSCQTKACTDGTGTAQCCTADCQVLGTGNPSWSVLDPTNPKTGGIKAKFIGAAPTDSDPFWCTFNPSTGSQYEREVHFNFYCDHSVSGVQPVTAIQNGTNDCRYMLEFKTAHACANYTGNSGLSGGWIFIIILVCCAFVYIVGGMGYGYFTTRKLEFPNMAFWTWFADLVREGFLFVGHGFKSTSGSMAGAGAYDEFGASNAATSGGATASYTAAPAAAKTDEPYTDL